MPEKGSYNKTIQKVIEQNPELDIKSTLNEQLTKSEWLDSVKDTYPGAVISKGQTDEEFFKQMEKEQKEAPLEAYTNLLHEVEKKLGNLMEETAAEYVPKLYACLSAYGYAPQSCKSKIYKDCKVFWHEDTIRRHLPEECKDKDKSKAAKLGNEKRKQMKLSKEFEESLVQMPKFKMKDIEAYQWLEKQFEEINNSEVGSLDYKLGYVLALEDVRKKFFGEELNKVTEEHSCENCIKLPPLAKKYCSNKVEAS